MRRRTWRLNSLPDSTTLSPYPLTNNARSWVTSLRIVSSTCLPMSRGLSARVKTLQSPSTLGSSAAHGSPIWRVSGTSTSKAIYRGSNLVRQDLPLPERFPAPLEYRITRFTGLAGWIGLRISMPSAGLSFVRSCTELDATSSCSRQ